MNNKKLLGKQIKEIRKSCGYTQEQLAEKVNIDITTLSGIESGRHFPSLVTLEKITIALNVPLIAFFDFNHHISIENMKNLIINNIEKFSDEDIKRVYKILNKKYMENII